MKKFYLLVSFLFCSHLLFSSANNVEKADVQINSFAGDNAFFEKNIDQVIDDKGNLRKDVHFYTQINGATLFFTNNGLVYSFNKFQHSKADSIQLGLKQNPYTNEEWEALMKRYNSGETGIKEFIWKHEKYRIDLDFIGANFSNYYVDESLSRKNIYYNPYQPNGIENQSLYEKITYKEIYPNTDIIFYFKDGKLKYDIVLHPGADPDKIKLLYKGHQKIKIDDEGQAQVSILPGVISEDKPYSYQNDKEVKSSFTLLGDTLMFQLDNYNTNQKLTIDPSIEWLTYFHDNSTSQAFVYNNAKWDSDGNMYLVFSTYNRTTFPTINPGGGAWYASTGGATGLQLVIMKFNSDRQIVWATYYASSQSARTSFSGDCVVVDQNNNLFVAGELSFPYGNNSPYTTSFPLYNPGGGAYFANGPFINGRTFLLKFSPTGQRLWATIFHAVTNTSSGLRLQALQVDGSNRLLVAGYAYTSSSSWEDIPTSNPGGSHYFKSRSATVESQVPTLFRFNTNLSLNWGTYISQARASTYNGSGEPGTVMDLDDNNNIFIATQVSTSPSGSSSGWTTVNPGGGAYIDGSTIVSVGNSRKTGILKFSSAGALVWSTLYGGSQNTMVASPSNAWVDPGAIRTNSNGDVYITGLSGHTNMPTYNPGGGAYIQTTRSTTTSSYSYDGFILKFSNGGVRRWATYYGGNSGSGSGTYIKSIGIDSDDNLYVGGYSNNDSPWPSQNQSGSYYQSPSNVRAITFAMFNSAGVRQWATSVGQNTIVTSSGGGWGFNSSSGGCGSGGKMMRFGYIQSTSSGTVTPTNPGGGAYYENTLETSASYQDFFLEFEIDGGSGGGGGGTPGIWGWTGAVSTDWFEPCNWDKASVPTSTSPVLIPGGTTNQPTIISGQAHCLDLEINSSNGGLLTVNTDQGGSLKVHQ